MYELGKFQGCEQRTKKTSGNIVLEINRIAPLLPVSRLLADEKPDTVGQSPRALPAKLKQL
jgi:hypothetical protein